NVLIELKARPAKYEDADQLAKYRTAIQETGTGNVIMWLVSPLIPKPIRDFLDSIGIDYTEIHEAEFRAIASKNSFTIQSETQSSPSLGRLTSWKGTSLHPNSNVAAVHRFAASVTSGGETDFLSRCDDDARHFFSRFFEWQKKLKNETQITWGHESGF